ESTPSRGGRVMPALFAAARSASVRRLALPTGQALDRGLEVGRLEAERSGSALEGDASLAIDQVEAIRPSRVGVLGRIVDPVHHRRQLDAETHDAHVGKGVSLFLA